MRKPTIVFVGSKGIPAKYGGFEQATQQMALHLVKKGYKVRVYSTVITEKEVFWKGIRIIKVHQLGIPTIDRLFREILPLFYELKEKIRRNSEKVIVHVYGPFISIPFWKLFGFKFVLSTDGFEWRRKSYNFLTKIIVYLGYLIGSHMANITTFDGKFIRNFYRKKWKIDGPVIMYGPKSSHIQDEERILREYNLKPKEYIIFVGRLVPEKGVHILIQAYLDSSIEFPLIILGKDPLGGKYRKYLEAISNSKVKFLGTIFDERFDVLLKNARVHVRPSINDSEGVNPVLIESMAYGVPIIASKVNQNVEGCGDAAIFVKPNNIDELSKTLELFKNSNVVEKWSRKSKSHADANFRWEDIVSKFEKIYSSIINK